MINFKHEKCRYKLLVASFFILIFLTHCVSLKPSFKKLAIDNPKYLVSKQDSLLVVEGENPELIAALIKAHFSLAEKEVNQNARSEKALNHFIQILILDKQNKTALYGKYMVEGHQLYKKGSAHDIWDAIVKFGRASSIFPERGVPDYWMAKSYEKKTENDFDLIIEYYESALKKELPEDLREEAQSGLDKTLNKKKTFDNFWK